MQQAEQLTINAIRFLSADGVQKANSGHPGLPMGAAAMAYTLWGRQMKYDPADPLWQDRDRFILSAGHGSMLVYSLAHLFGYGLDIEELKQFRQWGSMTPGHPEYGHTPGVETTTGPLGQGFANGVGMALAETYLAAKFNKPDFPVVDHYTYVLSGDGCMMEGITYEAASLAGTLKLGKLIVLYDSNDITIEGSTGIAFTEDVCKRFEAMGWHTQQVDDGNDVDAIEKAVEAAKAETDKPSMIRVRTLIGYGCPAKQGKCSAHGEPLGEENLKAAKENLDWPLEPSFYVPKEVYAHTKKITERGRKAKEAWDALFVKYAREYPDLAAEWRTWFSGELPVNLIEDKAYWEFEDKAVASRASSHEVINRLVERVPNLIGGSADLAPSTKTIMKGRGDFSGEDRHGANLHFGVREHAMAAIGNGMTLHGGLRPYVATFFVFSDYMKPAMRLSALMGVPLTYVLTHDSIGVGEDGPTHEPIEQLASLRSIPNMTVFRPADSRETAAGWCAAMTRRESPTALVLSRQGLPPLAGSGPDALKGAYVLRDGEKPQMILMASGSEVHVAMDAADILAEKGVRVRVVSMPSFELFEEQDEEYKESVLPDGVRVRLAIEAAVPFGWYKYVGIDGDVIGMEGFGASAPGNVLFEKFGFTAENVAGKALDLLKG
jgi:transketolase